MKKKLVKKNTGGSTEDPRLKKAMQDSAKARKNYNFAYDYSLKNPNAKPQGTYLAIQQERMDRPSKIRQENKKTGGSVKAKKKK